jgi:hypothetical protein
LEVKLPTIEGEFWVIEDMSSKQHRIQIGAETTLPPSPKQPGNAAQGVARKNGHALFIQKPLYIHGGGTGL